MFENMNMEIKILCLLVVVLGISHEVNGKSHYCPTQYTVRAVRHQVYYTNCGWWGRRCTRYRTYYVTEYRTNPRTCCQSYAGSQCNIPVCNNPTCVNNAVCIAPNSCYCRPGSGGRGCAVAKCTASNNCYPGTCRSGGTSCQCTSGFSGTNCEIIQEGGVFGYCRGKFSYTSSGGQALSSLIGDCGSRDPEEYSYYSGVGGPTVLTMEYEVNYVVPPDLPPLPGTYMTHARFGISHSYATALLITASGRSIPLPNIACSPVLGTGEQPPSTSNPHQKVKCNAIHTWQSIIQHNYRLDISIISQTGGFKEYLDPLTIKLNKTYFTGSSSKQSLRITFDLKAPDHCSTSKSCENEFQFPCAWMPDMTTIKTPTLVWFGWNDTDSGIRAYHYAVYSMEIKSRTDNRLTEVLPPLLETTWESGTKTPQINFTAAGMYSVILEVRDHAGNSAKARSVMLSDSINKVEIQPQHPITVSNVEVWESAFWITQTAGPLIVRWGKRYINKVHHNNHLLSAVVPMTGVIDDNSGNRTIAAVDNFQGVTKIEVNFNKGSAGSINNKPDGTWTNANLQQSYDIVGTIQDGQTIIFFIRAHDAVGNTQEESITIHIDATAAVYTPNTDPLRKNAPPTATLPYHSLVDLNLLDLNSGIKNISYTLIDVTSATYTVVHEASQVGQKDTQYTTEEQCIANGRVCYCIPLGPCYTTVQVLPIDHCAIKDLEGHSFILNFTTTNGAGLTTPGVIDIGVLNGLNGIEFYPKVKELRVIDAKESGTKATLAWSFTPACYAISGLRMVFMDGDAKREVQIASQSKTHQLTNLRPSTKYKVEISVLYEGGQYSDSSPIEFQTGEAVIIETGSGFGIGGIIGIVIGVLILILLAAIIVALIIRRKQEKPMIPDVVRETTTRIRNRLSRLSHFHQAESDPEANFNNLHNQKVHFANNCYSEPNNGLESKSALNNKMDLNAAYVTEEEEDDVYIYGTMDIDPKAQWKVSNDKIVIGNALPKGKGHFADLKLATLEDKNGRTAVVAKMNKVGANKEEKLLMTAKMNFLANGVPKHGYIVNFVAAVPPPQGSIILMEYCEEGRLLDWLKTNKTVTSDVEDMLASFSTHVAAGMQHLHKNQILHRRLGARNVLLKRTTGNQLVAKITGFGPMKGEHDNADDSANTREKVPIKWMAPEQFDIPSGGKRVYTPETDVWSYGITLHEIYSQGDSPYPDTKASNAKTHVRNGYRMPRSQYCPEFVYNQVVMLCWAENASDRPDFESIVSGLKHYFEGQVNDDDYLYDNDTNVYSNDEQ